MIGRIQVGRRRSRRLWANHSGDHNGNDNVSDPPRQLSVSDNALKRAHTHDQDSQPSPKSRRKLDNPVAQSDENLSGAENTYLTVGPSEDVMGHRKQQVSKLKKPIQPAWESLEYSILVQIFDYLHDPMERDHTNRFLLSAATTCKAFAEPALTALHKYPIICGVNILQKFVAHVSDGSPHTWCNYRQKVEILVIDVGVCAFGAARSLLGRLVWSLPRLAHFRLYHYKDGKPYRMLDESLRWTYPSDLTQALGITGDEAAPTRLKSWWWSKRMIDPKLMPNLRDAHLKPSFHGLQKLSFVNFQTPSLHSSKRRDNNAMAHEDGDYIFQIADSISVLPKLKHLVMESSTIVDGRLLSLLPTTIQHLELINCWEVTAEDFSAYLSSHGGQLEELTLKHNQSLSLSFLPDLSEHCPNLRALRMDFRFFSIHEFYNDCQPYYDFILEDNEIPTWPRSLQVIELQNLGEWMLSAAKNFFQSLADNAPLLVNLRRLVIKATLDIPWRERCEFRDHWVAKLNELFARKMEMPASAGSSSVVPRQRGQETPRRNRRGTVTPTRRSTRNAAVHGSDSPSQRNGVSRDLRNRTQPSSYRDPDTDADDSTSESERELESENGPPMSEDAVTSLPSVQGMCDVVDVLIDNQKPTEHQYGMEDFLDGYAEDDEVNNYDNEEWVSDFSEDEDYAW
ncbi:hypothetical protein UCRPA7_170 [Phaeoacremonium minimum UCRPA7]|uniref:Uncharacterized protein n=1 Tax=Phaeoacremonium minimum (strain UCR-PA7) TaxID=1286976 RepID=R8BY54_PHAM7|nr:hypothetical protein UCRPA7_170 [Phaeoacremonium minimum UCRPA7]EOO04283.1 hypothetical protein UCRPA7_170 [Phaeoacremonium minimum UCRPA7]